MYQKPDFKRYIAAETAAAIIGAAGAVGAAGTQAYASGKMNKRAEKFNREEAEKQRTWNENMAEKQNAWNYDLWMQSLEYDSPANQVQRLREAGLNPMYYGLDGNSAQAAPDAAQPLGYERAQAPNYENPASTAMAAAAQFAQIANIEAQTAKVKSETKAIDAKLPFEVDNLRAQVRSSNLSADAQETINKYIDQQQEAELRVKNSTAAEADAMVDRAYAEIDKMDYEKTTMMIGWLETQEKILTLQKNRELTDKQMEELASLIAVNYKNAKKIGLDVSNYDDITVIGTASHTMKFGPFTVQEGQPITLAMKKAAEAHQKELEEERRKKNTSQDGKPKGMYQFNDAYDGPIFLAFL